VPLLFVSFLVRHFGRRIHDRFEKVQEQLATINALVQENLAARAWCARMRRKRPSSRASRRRIASTSDAIAS
jgi:hypothetical protein